MGKLHETRDVSTLLLKDQLIAEASSTRLISDQRDAIQTAGARILAAFPCRLRECLKLIQVSVHCVSKAVIATGQLLLGACKEDKGSSDLA